ncbi:MAG: DUF1501 domain-containing protein [Planctomycetes bacterium]|nr:DUF1501 domain-containing protein [Planctomycetota bacterium]
MLQVGGIGVLGLTLSKLLRAEAISGTGLAPRADACILVFLNGGPSHLDMWDVKPDAPAEVRGEFKSIASSVPGIQFSEHLPRLAKSMHHCTLVRSMHHSVNNAHAAAVYVGLTGHDRGDANVAIGAGPNDYPAIGSVLGLCRPPQTPVVPFVSMPYITAEGRGRPPQPGFFGGWLGRNHDPLFVLRDPNAADFAVPELTLGGDVTTDRLDGRKRLIEQVHPRPHALSAVRSLQEMDKFQQKAFDLLTSPVTQTAFRLDEEPASVRDAYGRNIYGQSALLARRLIEAGTRCACISWAPDANATWDTHGQNFKKLKDELLPQLDAAVSSLLTDLVDRRMLDRTLVAVMGEFGRTPKVNGAAGRDHWNYCYTLMLAGGGIKGGFVYGSSDKIGARPASNPVIPAEIVATIYHCLGVPNTFELQDRLNRPFQIVPWGGPIRDLLA